MGQAFTQIQVLDHEFVAIYYTILLRKPFKYLENNNYERKPNPADKHHRAQAAKILIYSFIHPYCHFPHYLISFHCLLAVDDITEFA